MPRFYFNVRTAQDFVEDIEGVELSDLATAVSEAIKDARAAMAAAILYAPRNATSCQMLVNT